MKIRIENINDNFMACKSLIPLGDGFYFHTIYPGRYLINSIEYGFWHPINILYFHEELDFVICTRPNGHDLSINELKSHLELNHNIRLIG